MINFDIPLKPHLHCFLSAQIKIDDMGCWNFSNHHWFGRLILDQMVHYNDHKSYSNLTDCTANLKVKCNLDEVYISMRGIQNLNKKMQNRLDEYLFEWVRSRCISDTYDDNIKSSINSFLDYYNLDESNVSFESLIKKFNRGRECYSIPYLIRTEHAEN